jgi:rubrerythrin
MTLETVLETYAGYEKRAMQFYRQLSGRFADQAEVSRFWRQMSDAEASHFAVLTLAVDWVVMAGKGTSVPDSIETILSTAALEMAKLERAAESPSLTSRDAVRLTVSWEEKELRRILELLPHLPEKVCGQVRAGILGEAKKHYEGLAELIKQVGHDELVERVEALKTEIQTAIA